MFIFNHEVKKVNIRVNNPYACCLVKIQQLLLSLDSSEIETNAREGLKPPLLRHIQERGL